MVNLLSGLRAPHVQPWHEGAQPGERGRSGDGRLPGRRPCHSDPLPDSSPLATGPGCPAGPAWPRTQKRGLELRIEEAGVDSAKIRELDARYLASVLKVRFFPLIIERAEGCRITDADGVTRLDFTAGWAVANLG